MSPELIILGITFISIHLLANYMIPTEKIRRQMWLSFSGGMAVSYVFVYILPTLHQLQQSIFEYAYRLTMESELYIIGLLGLLIFYSIEKAMGTLANRKQPRGELPIYWMHLVFFAIYNMLIAYTVVSANVSGVQALFYGTAIGLHFITIAHDLWRDSPKRYNKIGRYVVVLGIIMGWIIGVFVILPYLAQAIIFAFISGAMILNVLKNELPHEQDAHFPSFAIGVAFYTTVTVILKFYFEW